MKKLLALLTAALLLTTVFSACKAENKITKTKLRNLSETTAQFETIKTQKYDNISFENCVFRIQQNSEQIHNVRATIKAEDKNCSNKEFYAEFIKQFKSYFPDTVFDEKNLVAVDSVEYHFTPYNEIKATFEDESVRYHYLHYISEDSPDVHLGLFNTKSHFPFRMSKGDTVRVLWPDGGFGQGELMGWNYYPNFEGTECTEYYNDGKHNGEVFHLSDGDMSIGDAIDFFENKYISTAPFDLDENVKFSVDRIVTAKLNADTYAYVFLATAAYNGVRLDRRGFGEYVDSREYVYEVFEAFMVKKDEIDTLYGIPGYDFENVGDPITSVVSLGSAVDIASKELTQGVKFDAKLIDFVYQIKYESDPKDTENPAVFSLTPAWRFTLYNENDANTYVVYVDAVSGAVRYYNSN